MFLIWRLGLQRMDPLTVRYLDDKGSAMIRWLTPWKTDAWQLVQEDGGLAVWCQSLGTRFWRVFSPWPLSCHKLITSAPPHTSCYAALPHHDLETMEPRSHILKLSKSMSAISPLRCLTNQVALFIKEKCIYSYLYENNAKWWKCWPIETYCYNDSPEQNLQNLREQPIFYYSLKAKSSAG